MKKLLSIALSAIYSFSCFSVYASENDIAITDYSVDMQTGVVSIEGSVSIGIGKRTAAVRVTENTADLIDITENELENFEQLKTNVFGDFSYTFTLNPEKIHGINSYDITTVSKNSGTSYTQHIDCIGEESLKSIHEDSVILNLGNKYAYEFGKKTVNNTAPIKLNDEIYAEAELLKNAFNLSDASFSDTTEIGGSVYVNIEEMKNFGKTITCGEKVFIISNSEVYGNPDGLLKLFGLYVSPRGSDNNKGTADAPLLSLNKAVSLADENKAFDGTHIYLMEGGHFVDEAVVIENKKDIKITSYAGENAVISGGIHISSADFSRVENSSILERVGASVRNTLVCADLGEYMDEVFGAREKNRVNYRLYNDTREQTLARYPNTDYTEAVLSDYNTDNVSDPVWTEVEYTLKDTDRTQNWTDVSNAWVAGFYDATYFFRQTDITSLDKATGEFKVAKHYGKISDSDIVIYNILEELDSPGEYYIDAESKMLYYAPDSNLGDIIISYSYADMFEITNSEHIEISGLTLEYGNANAVSVTQSKDVTLDNLSISSFGKNAVNFINSMRSVIKNSEIYNADGMGVNIRCFEDRLPDGGYTNEFLTLTRGDCGVENCHIYHCGTETNEGYGVHLYGTGNYAKNNTIHDSLSCGILIDGNDNLVTGNDIFNVCRDTYDSGAVYSASHSGKFGNVISNNYIHDIVEMYRTYGYPYGLYMDNFGSGFTVENNIVTNIGGSMFGGGRNNTINNNLFIDSRIHTYDVRATLGGWYRKYWNLLPEFINDSQWTDEMNAFWSGHYSCFDNVVEDGKKEKEYLDTIVWDDSGKQETANIQSSDMTKYYDAGLPRDVTITNNLLISDNGILLQDEGIIWLDAVHNWWDESKYEEYRTKKSGNLSVTRDFDNCNEQTSIDKYTDGMEAKVYNEYGSWFDDFEGKDYNFKENSTLSELMPQFKTIDFTAIGARLENINAVEAPIIRTPVNTQTLPGNVRFEWNDAKNADCYILTISKNSDMSNPILTQTAWKNFAVANLSENGKYYYTVTAQNLSKSGTQKAVSCIGELIVDILTCEVDTSVSNSKKSVKWTYNLSDNVILEGKAIIAEKTTDGKLIGTEIIDIPNPVDLQIVIERNCSSENIMECYLWNGLESMLPYTIKQNSK